MNSFKGTVCDFRLGYGKVLSRKSKIISVNRNKSQLTKVLRRLHLKYFNSILKNSFKFQNSDIYWKPTFTIQSDPASFLVQLCDSLSGFRGSDEWISSLKEKDNAKEESIKLVSNSKNILRIYWIIEFNLRTRALEPANINLNPIKVLQTLEKILPDNAILVADGGDFVATASYVLRPRGALTWLDPGAFGTLGVGGGFALGAKLVRPDSEVWIIYGDGSCGYTIAEYDTFTRHNVR